MFVTDGPFNKMSYSNKQYDELIEKTSSTLVTDLPARWKAFQDAEKILLEDDAAIAPIFQSGLVYLPNSKRCCCSSICRNLFL